VRGKQLSPAARTRAQRKALKAELDRVTAIAQQRLAEAIAEGLIEGRVEDGEIILDAPVMPPPAASRRRRPKSRF
jgi:hypothetical protein